MPNTLTQRIGLEAKPSLSFCIAPGTEPDVPAFFDESQKWHMGEIIDQEPAVVGTFAVKASRLTSLERTLKDVRYQPLGNHCSNQPFLVNPDVNNSLGRQIRILDSLATLFKRAVHLDMQRADLKANDYRLSFFELRAGKPSGLGPERLWHVDNSTTKEPKFRYLTTILGPTTQFWPGQISRADFNSHSLYADPETGYPKQTASVGEAVALGALIRFTFHTRHKAPDYSPGARAFMTGSATLLTDN